MGAVALQKTGDGLVLSLKQVSVSVATSKLIQDVTVSIKPAEFVAIIGPNGAGKSTLLKAMAGSPVTAGRASINGVSYQNLNLKQIATRRSVLPQTDNLTAALAVSEVIKLGLLPVEAVLPQATQNQWVAEIAEKLALETFLNRNYQTLSGGERARVRFARLSLQLRCSEVLPASDAAKAQYALLDEPLAALDLKYQRQMIDRMRELATAGTAVIAVIHDLNWLVGYVDRVLVMEAGRLVADGSPLDVLKNPALSEWYGTPLRIQAAATDDNLDQQPRMAVYA